MYKVIFYVEREYPRKNPGPAGNRTHDLPFSRRMLLPLSYWNPDDRGAEIGVGETKLLISLSEQSHDSQVVLHNPVGKHQKDHIST